MSKKKLDISILVVIILMGIYYIFTAVKANEGTPEGELGSGFFPIILGVALIGFCLVSILKWLKKTDEIIQFDGMKKILLTLGIIIVYFLAWEYIGYFYILTFFLLFVLFTFYRWPMAMKKSRMITVNLLVSLALMAFIYVLFNNLMYIDF
ncbi:tripartite tricarboxylate transporter TctB family protein [Sporosarcina sp. GW1-11]|uniref:tripartite tricarboxylate transporter TctB family protein n=1 Tax=Sporosarcina sp. GW1-11 TaxID=2899126 RepID=UPI00294EDF85|nr:tripartite tricarboxylate transporter TctB family protein [Sporosarcina sp. GW1-11]MDV6377444.1 tripartite tricarboxylate transporter TctB family protein [Sporosarcina sp. GW1-11]